MGSWTGLPEISKAINDLRDDMKRAGIVDEYATKIHDLFTEHNFSFNEFLELAKELANPAKVFFYGATGALIGIAILEAFKLKAAHSSNKTLENLLKINLETMLMSRMSLRLQAGQLLITPTPTLNDIEYNKLTEEQQEDRKLLKKVIAEARLIIQNTEPTDIKMLILLNSISNLTQAILENYYIESHSTDDMQRRLDCLTLLRDYEDVNNAIYHQKPTDVPLNEFDMNINVMRNLHGEVEVNALVKELTEEMKTKGMRLEDDACYYHPNPAWFLNTLLVAMINSWVFEGNALTHIDDKLRDSAALLAGVFNAEHNRFPKNMPMQHRKLIIVRAYLEYAQYSFTQFSFNTRHMIRTTRYGFVDTYEGVKSVVTAPITTVGNMAYALTFGLPTTVRVVFTQGYHQPMRLATSTAINMAIGAAVGAGASSTPKPGSGGAGGGSGLPGNTNFNVRQGGFQQGSPNMMVGNPRIPHNPRIPSSPVFTTTTPSAAAARTSVAAGTAKGAVTATPLLRNYQHGLNSEPAQRDDVVERLDPDFISVGNASLYDNLDSIYSKMIQSNNPQEWFDILLDGIDYKEDTKLQRKYN